MRSPRFQWDFIWRKTKKTDFLFAAHFFCLFHIICLFLIAQKHDAVLEEKKAGSDVIFLRSCCACSELSIVHLSQYSIWIWIWIWIWIGQLQIHITWSGHVTRTTWSNGEYSSHLQQQSSCCNFGREIWSFLGWELKMRWICFELWRTILFMLQNGVGRTGLSFFSRISNNLFVFCLFFFWSSVFPVFFYLNFILQKNIFFFVFCFVLFSSFISLANFSRKQKKKFLPNFFSSLSSSTAFLQDPKKAPSKTFSA